MPFFLPREPDSLLLVVDLINWKVEVMELVCEGERITSNTPNWKNGWLCGVASWRGSLILVLITLDVKAWWWWLKVVGQVPFESIGIENLHTKIMSYLVRKTELKYLEMVEIVVHIWQLWCTLDGFVLQNFLAKCEMSMTAILHYVDPIIDENNLKWWSQCYIDKGEIEVMSIVTSGLSTSSLNWLFLSSSCLCCNVNFVALLPLIIILNCSKEITPWVAGSWLLFPL